jgi:hypothetical protein
LSISRDRLLHGGQKETASQDKALPKVIPKSGYKKVADIFTRLCPSKDELKE